MGYPDKIRFAYGRSLSGVRTMERSWSSIVSTLTKGHRAYKDKIASTSCPNILGGPTDDRGKEHVNVLGRSLITLDYDDLAPDFEPDDMAFVLDMLGYAAVCYSTFSHRTERADGCARLRVIVPLDQEVSKETYPAVARALADEIGVEGIGKESFVAAQIMFLPSCMEGYEDQAWSHVVEGEPFSVEGFGVEASADGGVGAAGDGVDDDDSFLLDIAYEPMDVTDAEVDKALEMLPAEGLHYDDWMMVGMALYHQYRGSLEADGFGRWLAWSKQSSKHDGRQMRKKWRSCGGRSQPVTMASVFARVGGLGAVREALEENEEQGGGDRGDLVVAGGDGQEVGDSKRPGVLGLVDKLMVAAQAVEDMADYEKLKSSIVRLPERRLGADYRGMIAEELYSAWGKRAGLTKGKIEKALQPEKAKARSPAGGEQVDGEDKLVAVTEADCWREDYPAWIRGWVFDETDREFVRVDNGHAIKREAFSMKYDRMPECAEHEMDALRLASTVFPIPTVSGRMYWPGLGRIFERTNGMTYLNTWHEGGGDVGAGSGVVLPGEGEFEVGDDTLEGQAAAVFLRHLEMTVGDERERALMLDWMAWVYNNPGSRVRWALLLWGIEGNGKSYFHRVLTRLMGRDSRTVAASTIEERFTDWAEGCRLIGIEEIRVSGTNKWRTLDKMKPFISNDEIQVEGKGMKARVVPNFASYMLFTNHADAIPVGDGDRRYFVVFTRQRTKQDLLDQHGGERGVGEYFQTLFDVSMAGIGGIGRLLADHEYSLEFDPHGRAPDSGGKAEMRMLHISEDDEMLADAIEKFQGPYINDTIIDLTLLQDECEFDDEIELPNAKALAHKLVELGYTKGQRVRARKKRRRYWYQPNKISMEDAEKAVRGGGVEQVDPDIPF
jgi:hypothetical protein